MNKEKSKIADECLPDGDISFTFVANSISNLRLREVKRIKVAKDSGEELSNVSLFSVVTYKTDLSHHGSRAEQKMRIRSLKSS